MNKSILGIALVAVVAATSTEANAANITINQNNGTTYFTTGLVTDFSVISSQMNGMAVTAWWTVGGVSQGPQTVAWNSGATFTGSNFDLSVSGDTFDTNGWQLDFSIAGTGLLQKLEFNGIPGNTVFDRTNPSTGTPGSDQGKDFAGFAGYQQCTLIIFCTQGNITATYSNRVALPMTAPVGDLFTNFSMEFLSFGGLGEGTNWEFSLDTDIATTKLTTNPTGDVPEPASLMLLGAALVGGATRLRRRKA